MGTIDIKLRPVKLAFLVDPNDRPAILEAIRINTFLWGGTYNPLIPVFRRVPRRWDDRRMRRPKSTEILSGYLDAFDPDYVVPLGRCGKESFNVGNRRIISSTEVLSEVERDGKPRYGMGLFELLEYLIKKELRFVRIEPIPFTFPTFGKAYQLFLSSIFGGLHENIDRIFWSNFANDLGVNKKPCSLFNYCEFLDSDDFFLRRLNQIYLDVSRPRSWWQGECLFFLDANSPLDIVDYWNLRALGWVIFPIAKQAVNEEALKRFALGIIPENSSPERSGEDIHGMSKIRKSRSTSQTEVDDFVKSLRSIPSARHKALNFAVQGWYPRIWDEWARDKDNVEGYELESRITQHDLSNQQDEIKIRTLDPKFLGRFSYTGGTRFVNEVELRFYGNDNLLAEAIPEGGEELGRAVGDYGFGRWRFSRSGLVYLADTVGRSFRLTLPKAEDVFLSWLKSNGWEAELSSPGRVAKQMLKHMGGEWGMGKLANEGLINLLSRMSGGQTINKDAFWAELSRIASERTIKADPKFLLESLTHIQMFRLGIQIQCPVCWQRCWYSLKDADYDLQCSNCLERFSIRSRSPQEIEWSYRTFGPFSLPKQAYGVYSVILTLRFFSAAHLLDGATTPILSFTAHKDAKEIEADLGLFVQTSKFGKRVIELVFAECKTYNKFEKKDVDRMMFLASQFPGAILVFSTLRRSLSNQEKKLLRPLVNRGRRYWKAERPFNPVLVLTGIELFADWAPPKCWQDAGISNFPNTTNPYNLRSDLLQLCDATQQLHLGMQPWSQWLHERRERRRMRRSQVMNENQKGIT